MTKYRFHLLGVPPEQVYKEIDINVEEPVKNIEIQVKREYRMIGLITLACKDQILMEEVPFKTYNIDPARYEIMILSKSPISVARYLSRIKRQSGNKEGKVMGK